MSAVELRVVVGVGLGNRYRMVPGEAYLVGRGEGVAIQLHDEAISRRHATLEVRDEGLFVTDLASANGSFLSDEPLAAGKPTLVVPGDILRFGSHELTLLGQGASPEASFLPPDEFEILGELGRGGGGRVFAARQKLLGRKVAIKILDPLHPDEEDDQRFLREAQLLVQIEHPHVLRLYELRIVRGRPIMVLELVEGPSIEQRLGYAGVFDVPEVLRIGVEIAGALATAHKREVIHRDVKPGNILLEHDTGSAKLIDFGIGKRVDSVTSLTQTGIGMGSYPYLSPEQLVGAASVDHRADLHGLGATLFHMLTGEPHAKAPPGDVMEMYRQLEAEAPLIHESRPDCPPALSALLRRMLASSPEARPGSAEEVVQALERIRSQGQPGVPLPPAGTTTRRVPRPRRGPPPPSRGPRGTRRTPPRSGPGTGGPRPVPGGPRPAPGTGGPRRRPPPGTGRPRPRPEAEGPPPGGPRRRRPGTEPLRRPPPPRPNRPRGGGPPPGEPS